MRLLLFLCVFFGGIIVILKIEKIYHVKVSRGSFQSLWSLTEQISVYSYKQISEGYDDRKHFEIMGKIGMTTKEIKKSITSQILTVFGLPLFAAGFHLSLFVIHYSVRMLVKRSGKKFKKFSNFLLTDLKNSDIIIFVESERRLSVK